MLNYQPPQPKQKNTSFNQVSCNQSGTVHIVHQCFKLQKLQINKSKYKISKGTRECYTDAPGVE